MASTGNNDDSLNENKLKPVMQSLAAGILRENKNIEKVKIKAKITTKTTRKESDEPGGEKVAEKEPNDREDSQGKSGESNKDKSGQEGQGEKEPERKSEADKEPVEKSAGDGEKADENQGVNKSEEKLDDESKKQEEGGPSVDSTGSRQASSPRQDSGQAGQENKGEEKKSQAEDEPEAKKDFPAGGGKGATPDSATTGEETPDGAAGKLREKWRGNNEMAETALDMVDSDRQQQRMGETGSPRDWATAVREATNIKRQAERLKEKAKGKIEEAVAAPIKQATNRLLQQAWINLPDSFGLTLIYINMHVFLHLTLSDKLFCKLGEEWLPKQAMQAGGGAAEPVGRGIGLVEVIVFLILDLIVLCVILAILALIIMIVQFIEASWLEKTLAALKAFWGAGWGAVEVLYKLF